MQQYGVDYSEFFAPVVRTLISLVFGKGMKVMTLDIKAAFFHGNLDEEA